MDDSIINQSRIMQEDVEDRAEIIVQNTLTYLGDELLAVLTESGQIYLSLPALCTALGLNVRGQLQRIQRNPRLSGGLCQLPLRTRGGTQQINCLLLDAVHPWLAGVQTRTITDTMRYKIEQYEAEFLQTIADAFHIQSVPRQAQLPFVTDDFDENDELSPFLPVPSVNIDPHELRDLLLSIPYVSTAATLVTTSFQEDRAIREATLARKTDWEEEPEFSRMRYPASNKLYVYVGDPDHPLGIPEAMERIRHLGESTILTARILLGLWNIRRSDGQLMNGSAAVRINEILEWRGVQKHSKAYDGTDKRFTDGYQWKHKQQVHRDIKLLEQCYLRGAHTIVVNGRVRRFLIDGPYLRVTSVRDATVDAEGETVGYFVAPGAWINTYEAHGNAFFAEIDRRIFQLHPQNEQIALRIALYLTEHWRQYTRSGEYPPLIMNDLLMSSMVAIDRANLTSRFAPRVEAAIATLVRHGIVGEARLLSYINRDQPHWGKDWLAARWSILPPLQTEVQGHIVQLPAPETPQRKNKLLNGRPK